MEYSLPPVLDELHAVVVPATFNGDVFWDKTNNRWLAEADYNAPGWRVQEAPSGESTYGVRVRVPNTYTLDRAANIATAFKDSKYLCGWCGVKDLRLHVIVPDILGEPVLRCVLRPDPTTVHSFGGNGEKKHWAYAAGDCPSVRHHEVRAPGDAYGPLVGVNLFGDPFTTLDALDRRWCAKCYSAASAHHANREFELAQALGRQPNPEQLRRFEAASNRRVGETQLLMYLAAASDERGVQDVRQALRDAWQPLTAEAFIEGERGYGGGLFGEQPDAD